MGKSKRLKENQQIVMEGVSEKEADEFQNVDEEKTEFNVSDGQVSFFGDDSNDAMIDEDVARDRLQQAIETEKPKKKRKSIITTLIFLALNIFIMFFIIRAGLKEANGMPFSEIVKTQGNRLWWLAGAFGLFLLVFFADSMIFYYLIKNATGKKRPWLSFKVSAVGRYIDNITPFSVGGQPSQILNLTKAGLSPGVATSIPIIKLIVNNTVYSVSLILIFVFGVPFLPASTYLNELLMTLLKIIAVIGLFFTALFNFFYILIGTGKIVGRSLVRFIVRLGYKLKIVKNYRVTYNKFMKQVLEYQTSIKYLKNNKKTMIACIIYSFINVFAFFAIPFVVVMAFSNIEITSFSVFMSVLWICMTKFVVGQMASVVIPLPGGTGMMELSFIALFGVSSLIGNAYIIWGLLAWRFFTYYLIILQGFTISMGSSIKKLIKARKTKRKEEVLNDSQDDLIANKQ